MKNFKLKILFNCRFFMKFILQFQYAWAVKVFQEMATYVFFVINGYKFRPTIEGLCLSECEFRN